jgi:hypothetical protein
MDEEDMRLITFWFLQNGVNNIHRKWKKARKTKDFFEKKVSV